MNSLSFFTDNIYDTLPRPRAIRGDVQEQHRNIHDNVHDANKDREYGTQTVGVKTKGYRRMALLCNKSDVI